MKEWHVYADVRVQAYKVVKASTKAKALKKAESDAYITLCHQCSSGTDDNDWALNDPEIEGDIRVEEKT